jgi:hypothetical protein
LFQDKKKKKKKKQLKNNNNNENDLVPGNEEWWSILNRGSASGCCRRYLRLGCWPTWSAGRIEIEINIRYFLSKKHRQFECTYITNIAKQWNEIVLWFGSLKTRRESFAIRRRHWTTARAIIFRFYWRLTKKAFSLQTQICKKQKKYIRDHYLILFIYIFIYIFLQLSRVNANMELKDRKGEKSRYGKKKEDSSDLIKFFCSSTLFFLRRKTLTLR